MSATTLRKEIDERLSPNPESSSTMTTMALPINKIKISPAKSPGAMMSPVKTSTPTHKRRSSSQRSSEDNNNHKKRRHTLPCNNNNNGNMKEDMFQHYQPWVIQTYGDSAKTKTITLRKYARIIRTLRGEESNSVENSKFRFWVKAKGFRIGQPPGYVAKPADGIIGTQTLSGKKDAREDPALYVPTSTSKDGLGRDRQLFKKVAVVENFFDIIYSVHVEMEGRAGKHAGQKRTYRAITEAYAFLPREAVTRFLLGCTDCQRRPHSPSPSASPTPYPVPTPGLALHPATPLPPRTLRAKTPDPPPTEPFSLPSPVTPQSNAAASKDSNSPQHMSLKASANHRHRHHNNNHLKKLVEPPDIDFSLPITTTYLKHMRSLGYTDEDALKIDVENANADPLWLPEDSPSSSAEVSTLKRPAHHVRDPQERQDNVSTPEPDVSEDDHFPGAIKDAEKFRQMLLAWNSYAERDAAVTGVSPPPALQAYSPQHVLPPAPYKTRTSSIMSYRGGFHPLSCAHSLSNGSKNEGRNGDLRLSDERDVANEDVAGLWAGYHNALGLKKSTPPGPREQSSPLLLSDRSLTQETGSVHDETSSSGNKEDEDDDEDDGEDKIDPHQYDPERLKAFNMFVRLFVDENLDRIVPISKQPKEKIQAIIDSCTRQFPEFAERARKRIRTYLKSCRRNKRSRDTNGAWDATRPTPAHLTSVQAEQILAQACENESHNAKRMRLGLEPVSQPMPLLPSASNEGRPSPMEHYTSPASDTKLTMTNSTIKTEPIHSVDAGLSPNFSPAPGIKSTVASVEAMAKSINTTSAVVTTMNGNAISSSAAPTAVYRPNFSQAFQRVAATGPYPTPLFPTPPFGSGGMVSNGPTDLSMKTKPLLSHKLNTAEMAAVRQLITGYRESAAFLLRSADELEQLLLQQQ